MCGIVYYKDFNNNKVNNRIIKQYYAQKSRGSSGFGFLAVGKIARRYRYTTEYDTKMALLSNNSSEMIFHHRLPTSTKNTLNSAHPIKISKGKHNYYLVHNGIISNTQAIYNRYKKQNKLQTQVGQTFNDSEMLLWEISALLENKIKPKDFNVNGSYAFIVLKTDKHNKPISLYFCRNGNPLKMHYDKDYFSLSSEGEGQDIEYRTLYRYDYKDSTITQMYDLPNNYTSFGSYYGNSYYNDTAQDIDTTEQDTPTELQMLEQDIKDLKEHKHKLSAKLRGYKSLEKIDAVAEIEKEIADTDLDIAELSNEYMNLQRNMEMIFN
jgi:glucosamine 6-phosphate synthetase-like amidotransferase/phosphosugar isomerase protein